MDYLEPPPRNGDQPSEVLPVSRILLFVFSEPRGCNNGSFCSSDHPFYSDLGCRGCQRLLGSSRTTQTAYTGGTGKCSVNSGFLHFLFSGVLGHDRGLLLAVLALLLHEPDEPPDRPNCYFQHSGSHPLLLGQLYTWGRILEHLKPCLALTVIHM